MQREWVIAKAVINGDVKNGSVMAGQSIGMVTKIQPMREIIAELMGQAENQINASTSHQSG